jgi:hypothetical protein
MLRVREAVVMTRALPITLSPALVPALRAISVAELVAYLTL